MEEREMTMNWLKSQHHSILDEGFKAMRKSFDRTSNTSKSGSSRQSPSIRKKSELRRLIDEMKSNHSSVGNYSEDVQFPQYNQTMQSSSFHNTSSVGTNLNLPTESPMK